MDNKRILEIIREVVMGRSVTNPKDPRKVMSKSTVAAKHRARRMYREKPGKRGSGIEQRTNATINPPRGRN